MEPGSCIVCHCPAGDDSEVARVVCANCGVQYHLACLVRWYAQRAVCRAERCVHCSTRWVQAFPDLPRLIYTHLLPEDDATSVVPPVLRPAALPPAPAEFPLPRPHPARHPHSPCAGCVARGIFAAQMVYLIVWSHAAVSGGTCQNWVNPFASKAAAVCYLSRNYSQTASGLLVVLAHVLGVVGVWMSLAWTSVRGNLLRRMAVVALCLFNLGLLVGTGGPRAGEFLTELSTAATGFALVAWEPRRHDG